MPSSAEVLSNLTSCADAACPPFKAFGYPGVPGCLSWLPHVQTWHLWASELLRICLLPCYRRFANHLKGLWLLAMPAHGREPYRGPGRNDNVQNQQWKLSWDYLLVLLCSLLPAAFPLVVCHLTFCSLGSGEVLLSTRLAEEWVGRRRLSRSALFLASSTA